MSRLAKRLLLATVLGLLGTLTLGGCGGERATLDTNAGLAAANPFAGSYYGYSLHGSAIIFAADITAGGIFKMTIASPFLHGSWVGAGTVSNTGAAKCTVNFTDPDGKAATVAFTGKFTASGGSLSGQGTCVVSADPKHTKIAWVAKSRRANTNAGKWTVQRKAGGANYSYGQAFAVLGTYGTMQVMALVFKGSTTGYACDSLAIVIKPGSVALGKPATTMGMSLCLSTAAKDWFRNKAALDSDTSPTVTFSARQLKVGGVVSGSIKGTLYRYDNKETAKLTSAAFKRLKILDNVDLN